MDDLISRQAALDILDDFADVVLEVQGGAYEKARKAMCELPGKKAVATGQWERKWEDWRHQMSWLECSVCHAGSMDDYDYCPNCGTEMEGVRE